MKRNEHAAPAPGSSPRIASLDAFRGLTIMLMLLVNNPGSWGDIYPVLRHADWNGWTLADMVFPFFLWIVGFSIALSIAPRIAAGAPRARLMRKIFIRAAIIFALGLALNAFPFGLFGPPFDPGTLRIPGVLQRIALCYLGAALLTCFATPRRQLAIALVILAAYWYAMTHIPVPNVGTGVLEKGRNLAAHVDSLLLAGHLWPITKTWDPEGILSTLPAVATTILGAVAGSFMRGAPTPSLMRAMSLCSAGSIAAVSGIVAGYWFPINKSIWTSSYVLLMAGLCMIVFAAAYSLIEFTIAVRPFRPFIWCGRNPLTLFIASVLFAKTLSLLVIDGGDGRMISLRDHVFRNHFLPLADPAGASLLYAIAFCGIFMLIGWLLWRRGIFIAL